MRSIHLKIAHSLWKEHLKIGDVVIDATCGNGYDSEILANCVLSNESGYLHCVDIQQDAIINTKERLKGTLSLDQYKRVTFYRGSHAFFPLDWPKPHLIVYNLGYLPGGDKSLTTTTQNTLKSLKMAYSMLQPKGMLSIMCYPGHSEGLKESNAIKTWLTNLKTATYINTSHSVNIKTAPFLITIIK